MKVDQPEKIKSDYAAYSFENYVEHYVYSEINCVLLKYSNFL
jgi:hypothetical protein